jgi:hypothetical protein
MTRLGRWLAVLGVVTAVSDARAQAIYTPRLSDLPTHEVGAMLGIYSLMDGGGFAGLRVTRSFNPVIAVEVSGDHKSASSDYAEPSVLMFTAAARLTPPIPPDLPRPYVTLGVARAFGFTWDVSPMIAAGVQSAWADGVFSFRMEVQRFTSGERRLYDRARLVLSGVIGFGGG